MRIGELSERTGTPRRLLRYYEEQGLLVPDRTPNGYRDYAERTVDRVLQIRGLLEAGLPTRARPKSCSNRFAITQTEERSTTVKSLVAWSTLRPTLARRSVTTPAIGAGTFVVAP